MHSKAATCGRSNATTGLDVKLGFVVHERTKDVAHLKGYAQDFWTVKSLT